MSQDFVLKVELVRCYPSLFHGIVITYQNRIYVERIHKIAVKIYVDFLSSQREGSEKRSNKMHGKSKNVYKLNGFSARSYRQKSE